MKAIEVRSAGGRLELSERALPEPGPGQVRLRIAACGICRSDVFGKEGAYPGIQFPRVPGHEVAGVIDTAGADVLSWEPGQRAGVGWHGGHCGACPACFREDFVACRNLQIPGISYDGGYAEYMIVPAAALVRIPEPLDLREAAPILCAGVTAWKALRESGVPPGGLIAVHGIGGLGHMAVQFANRLGFRVAAISRGSDKEAVARTLGAEVYIDLNRANPARELQKFGGARAILATAPNANGVSALVDGLSIDGKLMILAAIPEPLRIPALQLLAGRRSVQGCLTGTAADSADALRFCVENGIRPVIEQFPLDRAAEAFQRMVLGKARFRAVIINEAREA